MASRLPFDGGREPWRSVARLIARSRAKGGTMTDISLPAYRFNEREFRVGDAMSKSIGILWRNMLPFGIVSGIAALPSLLMFQSSSAVVTWILGGMLLAVVLSGLSQAIVLNAAFEHMRGRPVDMLASFRVGVRRFLPVMGVTLLTVAIAALSAIALIVPFFIVGTILFVATPVCVVERLGPFQSLGRSAALTKGSRWRLFGMLIVIWLIALISGGLTEALIGVAGPGIALVVKVIWNGLLGAYSAILVVVTYHDLRVAKEGVDTDQIAAVFE
jgi:hypothetical protein